ncbi:hypothetical protein MKX73_19300 [Solibacillus sp. FSL W7-1436]|uniref:hypothetical protein n=1 Tax=Solibacillus sp. FSL W7-1436 TaxID=2921705 RepID=UPI0030FA1602
MTFEKMLEELEGNGFKIIRKENKARIIKNNKAMTYSAAEWDRLNTQEKIMELNALHKAF